LNGSITLRIPLFSLPQRGRLSLSFSLYGTTTVWTTTHTCNSQPSLSAPCYTVRSLNQFIPVGPQLIIDQYLSTLITQYRYPANSNTFYNIFSLTDATGASHPLGYDNSNLALLRATDGSGFLYAPATATPDSPFFPSGGYDGTIYDVAGIQETITNASSFLPTTTFKDSDGNSIILNYTGSSIATSQVTDSLGRVFPGIPNWNSQHTSSIAGCPSVSANFQSTTSSINWTVPGPNGGQQTFLFCYASVFYRTNLVAPTCTYGTSECVQTSGTVPALQSIVLPNGTYWAFTYDAANPSDNTSFGYAQVTQVRLPTGGTITYQYQNFMKSCAPLNGTPNFSRSVVSRTFTPLIGTPTTWNYNFNSYPINTATDPLGNDTVYTFTALGTGCDLHETKQQIYQGAQSAGKVLQTRATAYQFAATNPQSGVFNGGAGTNTAVLPTTVTTTLDNNQATTTTTQYNDGGFTDVQPACTAGANNTFSCTYSATQQMPLGLVTSTSTTDYGGSTLKTIQTQYLFQQNSSYRAANFLNQIASTTILNGSGTQVAKTTYGYDENNGSPQGIFAHKTSVNRWLNTTGANITSKTVYNTQGMPSQSIDPVGNATRYSYDTTGAFVTQIQKPDTTLNGITTHHVTNYTYDTVSGKPLTLTDENSNQTSYAYDNMARLISTTYPSPDGGQTTTCYTDSGGATCAQTAAPFQIIITDKLSASQNKITTTYVDGLGRVTQTLLNSDPDGATYSGVTIYDGLDRPSTVYNPTRCNPPTTNCGESTWGTNSNQYDALGRITQVTNPNGSTVLTTYTGRAAQISDEGNGTKRVQRITQSDALAGC